MIRLERLLSSVVFNGVRSVTRDRRTAFGTEYTLVRSFREKNGTGLRLRPAGGDHWICQVSWRCRGQRALSFGGHLRWSERPSGGRQPSRVVGTGFRLCVLCGILVLLLSGDIGAQSPAWKAPVPGQALCCASETNVMRWVDAGTIRRRFQIYRETGFDMLRVEGLDASLQDQNGRIVGPRDLPYLLLARASNFRLKVNVSVFTQPDWYFRAHPQSRFINEDGAAASGVPGFWDPGTRERVAEVTGIVFAYMAEQRLFDNVDYIAPDFGPASEPIYPAAWTQEGPAKKAGEAFWFYGPSAQADFVRAMAARYRTVTAANANWGTNFHAWSEVSIPKPGKMPGPFWNDVLTWYRDSKRDFINWQIHNFKARLAKYPQAQRIKLLLYMSGTHYTGEEWRQAVQAGSGAASIRLMCDSEFLLDTAAREGCLLQYTGCENVPEVHYLFDYMHRKGNGIPMIGENAGQFADQPERIADAITGTELSGIDYTHTDVAFGPDTATPSPLLSRIKLALQKVTQAKRRSTSSNAQ